MSHRFSSIQKPWPLWKNLLGFIWAAPVTLFGFSLCLFGVKFVYFESEDWSLHFYAKDGGLLYRMFRWGNVGAMTIGSVIFYGADYYANIKQLVLHERVHVRQCAKFGIFDPIMYYISALIAWLYGQDIYSGIEAEEEARALSGEEELPESIQPHGGIRGLRDDD